MSIASRTDKTKAVPVAPGPNPRDANPRDANPRNANPRNANLRDVALCDVALRNAALGDASLLEEDGWIFRERPGLPVECFRIAPAGPNADLAPPNQIRHDYPSA